MPPLPGTICFDRSHDGSAFTLARIYRTPAASAAGKSNTSSTSRREFAGLVSSINVLVKSVSLVYSDPEGNSDAVMVVTLELMSVQEDPSVEYWSSHTLGPFADAEILN